MMRAESNTQNFIRVLQNYKLYLQLHNRTLRMKLFSNQKSAIYHSASIEYRDLNPVFSAMFIDIQEVYNEFKLTNQQQFSFNPQNCQFKYILKLAMKSFEMCIKLKASAIQRQQQLQIENILLEKNKEELESQVADKGRQIQQYKEKVKRLDELLRKYQMENISQLENFLNQIIKYADTFFFTNKTKENVIQIEPNNGTLKRSQKLWDVPACKFFKNSQGRHEKLQKRHNQLFLFFPLEESVDYEKFFFQNCRLRLVQTCPIKEKYYLLRANSSTNITGRTTLGLKLQKQINESKGITIGLRQNEDEEIIQEMIDVDSISYNLKTGMLVIHFDGQKTVEQMMAIKEGQSLHLSVDVESKTLQCYRNETLIKQFELPKSMVDDMLIPFVKMSAAGEQLEFL